MLPAANKPYLLPTITGIYLLYGHVAGRDDAVYYIGQSANINNRATTHAVGIWFAPRVVVLHELFGDDQRFALQLENSYVNAGLHLGLPLINAPLRRGLVLRPERVEAETRQLKNALNLLKGKR